MVTQSTLAGTTRRSLLGPWGMVLLIGIALGFLGMYTLETFPSRAGAAKTDSHNTIGAIRTSSGQDVLSVEWLEQQHATNAAMSTNARPQDDVLSVDWLAQQRAMNGTAPSNTKTQDDVLSVEWLERNRQGTPNTPQFGSAAQSVPDNYIGFIE